MIIVNWGQSPIPVIGSIIKSTNPLLCDKCPQLLKEKTFVDFADFQSSSEIFLNELGARAYMCGLYLGGILFHEICKSFLPQNFPV